MAALGLLFLLFGALATWVFDNSVEVGNQLVDMDLVGVIFLILGSIALVFGLYQIDSARNTLHREEIYEDKVEREVAVEEKPKVVRKSRKKL